MSITTPVHDGTRIPTADPKDVESDVWYGFNYALQTGETISASTWLIDGVVVTDGTTVNTITFVTSEFTGGETKANIQGGTLGNRYKLTNRLVTNMTPSDDKSLYFTVKQL